MTKSRSALLILLAASWPGAAFALPDAAVAAPGLIAAPPDPLGDVARQAALRRDAGCNGGSETEVVVCGRRGEGFRIPDEPEPGARIRLTAGELPTGMAAMNAGGCLRLCSQPVMIDVVGAFRAISRGLDRILHPD